jgi:uncharacterized membrane protein
MWVVFSLLTAFFQSIVAAFGKRGTQQVDPLLVAWSQNFFSLFILLPLSIVMHAFQQVNTTFIIALSLSASLYTITSILFFKTLKESPISLTLPILSFVPIFTLITSPLILREYPSMLGMTGIVVTVIGSYILNLSKRVDGLFEPLLSIVKEKGSRRMLIIASIWSITSNVDKLAIVNANPFIYPLYLNTTITLFLTCVLLLKRTSFVVILKKAHLLAPVGITTGVLSVCQTIAFSMTIVPNVVAVKRISALFGILWGKWFFNEENLRERFFGAAIMVVGVVIIVWSY